MPTFIVEYQSTGGGLRSRGDEYKAAQNARKEYRKSLAGRIVLAGPKFETTADSESVSSIMIIEADDIDSAREIAAKDPYYEIGEFSGFTVNEIALTSFNSGFALSN